MTSHVLPVVTWSLETRRLAGRPSVERKSKASTAPGMSVSSGAPVMPLMPAAPVAAQASQGSQGPQDAKPTEPVAQAMRATVRPHAEADGEEVRRALEQAREAARKEGHAEGFAKGAAEAKAKWQAETERLTRLTTALEKQVADTIAEWEGPVVDMTLSACRKILGAAALSGQAARAVVQQTLQTLRKETLVEVRVNPSDLDFLRATVMSDEPGGIPWRADDSVGRGGCTVVFAGGTLDARIETQMRALAQVIANGMKRHD